MEYHRELFEEYRPERLELERRQMQQENELGYRLVAEISVPKKWVRPTAEQLLRHAERYGPEEVKTTAAAVGVSLNVKKTPAKPPSRRRRTTPELQAQVLELAKRGLVTTAIADALQVSDRRVVEILRRNMVAS